MAYDISVDDLVNIFVDSILEEKYLNKETLLPKVQSMIKSFVRLKNTPKNYNKIPNPNKQANQLRALEKYQVELKYWLEIVRKMDANNMPMHYENHRKHMLENGFY